MISNTQTKPRSGASITTIVIVLVIIAVLVGGGFMMFGGRSDDGNGNGRPDLFHVKRGSFDIAIPTSGELAALDQIEIRNQLDTRGTITYIVDEGTGVKAGETLITLNDEEIRDRIKDAEDTVNTADNALFTATSNLELKLKEHESQIEQANLEVKLARLALEAWTNGEDPSRREQLDLEIQTAQKNHDRLAERYELSQELAEQEFISQDELKRDEISLIEAQARLRQARLDKEVYINYQFQQEQAKKESDLEQAEGELERLIKRQATEIASLESDVDSREFQLQIRRDRLAKYQRQLEDCTTIAPADGLVVYASSLESGGGRRGNPDPPEVGTEVYPNELIMILPDTSRLVAVVKVNEALSGQIESGQHATIVSDALPDTVLTGKVYNIGVLAEGGGWRDPNRRDYTVKILLTNGNDLGLKPSMRCKADVFVGRVDDALFVPIQAVFRNGPIAYVYIPRGSGYTQRQVTIGRASELYVEITSSLEQDETVLLREPPPERIVEALDFAALIPDEFTGIANGNGQRPPDAMPPADQGAEDRPEQGQQGERPRQRPEGTPQGQQGERRAHPQRPQGGRPQGQGGQRPGRPASGESS